MLLHWVLPLTGRSESVGTRQLQLASCQSLEHSEQILSRPPEDGEKTKTKTHQRSPNQINFKRNVCSICIFKVKYTATTNNISHVVTYYPFIENKNKSSSLSPPGQVSFVNCWTKWWTETSTVQENLPAAYCTGGRYEYYCSLHKRPAGPSAWPTD